MSVEAKLKQTGLYDDIAKLMSAASVDDWSIEMGGKHPKVVYRVDGQQFSHAVPGSPSDSRSVVNTKLDLRRRLMHDGLIKAPSKAGRKRKQGVGRYPGGQIKHAERERDAVETVVQQRIKHNGATRENARHQEWGYPLGVLHKQGEITREQKEAGDQWIMALMRYWRLKGYAPPNPKVASYAEMIAGLNIRNEPDDEDVIKAQRAWFDIDNWVKEACKYEDLRQVYGALHKILVLQTEVKYIKPVEIGYLRLALNPLVRLFRIGG